MTESPKSEPPKSTPPDSESPARSRKGANPDEEDSLDSDELGLDGLIEDLGDESVSSLDDSVGLDDDAPLFALELPPEEAREDEGTDDLDSAVIEIEADDEEYGWVDEGDADEEESWDASELDLPELAPLGRDDGGEEGVDEEVDLGGADDDSAAHLPALHIDDLDDDGDEELELGADAMITGGARREGAPIELPPRFEDGLEVLCFEARGAHLSCLSIEGGWVAGEGLFRVPDSSGAMTAYEASELEGAILAMVASPDGDELVVCTADGVLRSSDGARSFRGAPTPVDSSARLIHERTEGRVWLRAQPGELHRVGMDGSLEGPLLFEPTVELAAPDRGGVLALCKSDDAPVRLVGSGDGGERWVAIDGPSVSRSVEGARWAIAVDGDAIALGNASDSSGPFLSIDGGRSWARVPGVGPTGAMALLREGVGRSLYAAHPIEHGEVVVRHRPAGGEPGVVLDVGAELAARGLPHDPRARSVRALAVRSGRIGSVFVLTANALFEVRVDPDEVG